MCTIPEMPAVRFAPPAILLPAAPPETLTTVLLLGFKAGKDVIAEVLPAEPALPEVQPPPLFPGLPELTVIAPSKLVDPPVEPIAPPAPIVTTCGACGFT